MSLIGNTDYLNGRTPVERNWDWWNDFLQREYYDTPEESGRWDRAVGALSRDLNLEPGMRVLDLGSGSGAVIRRLALRGIDPIGVERSPDLVAEATRAALESGVQATFIEADMFAYEPTGTFDAVLSLNTSFGYGTDAENRNLIARIGSWLKPNGRFLLDVATADHAAPFGTWHDSVAGGTMIVENEYVPDEHLMINRPVWLPADSRQAYTTTAPEIVRLYMRDDLEQMMRSAGMNPQRRKRALGRRFVQTDDDMHTTWIAIRRE